MILLDLFSGIGGFHLGLERAGFDFSKTYYSEIDQHAIANYKYNFKNIEYVGDVKSISTSGIRRPNIITFGSPCQDFSLAGKRKGLEGERSSLIEHALRAISKFRPDVFIWENVKGAFSSNNSEDFWAIIQAFANIGGYTIEWQLLNTAWVLPQNRERIYLVGHLTESFRNWKSVFPITENDFTIKEVCREDGLRLQPKVSTTITTRYGDVASDTYVLSRGRGFCKDSINEVCPTIRGSSFEHNTSVSGIRRLTEIECERLQGFPDNWTKYGDYEEVKEIAKTNRYKLIGNAVTVDVVKLVGERIFRNYEIQR